MNEANPRPMPTQRQQILLDVFRIFTDVGIEAKTNEQLILMDKITTYVDEKVSAVAGEQYHAGYMDGNTARRLDAEDRAADGTNDPRDG